MPERSSIILDMNILPFSKQVGVISALVEGNSIRATVRLTGVAKGTILRLLEDVGEACAEFHDRTIRNINPDVSSAMKSGNSAMRKRRTFLPTRRASSATVMCGPGPQLTQIPS